MKLTKKFFAVVLSVAMIMSLMICAYGATFSDVDSTNSRYTAISTLADMGIINGYTDGTFKPDDPVKRSEMAKLITLLFNYTENTVTTSPFSDVANDHWAINYIATMKDFGIINGYPDGTFAPENEVTYEQAIKMIVCALNWGEVAKESSTAEDWSLGYRSMASKLGVTKYVYVTTNSDPASRGTIAQLLYNSLEVKPAEKVVDSSGKVSYTTSDKTIQEDKQEITTLDNVQIVCTPEMNIQSNTQLIKSGYIRIKDASGNSYDVNASSKESELSSYTGRYADVKLQKDSDNNYSLVTISLKGDETNVDIRRLKDVSSSTIEYYTDEAYERTTKLNVSNPTVIYNNRVIKNSADFVDLLKKAANLTVDPKDEPLNYFGSVDFIDSSEGDLIVIKSYKSYYMDTAVDSSNYLVTLTGLEEQVYIPVKDTVSYEIKKKSSLEDKGSTPTTLSITSKSVVTLMRSTDDSIGDTKYIEYYVNSSKATGTPTEVSTPYGPDCKTVAMGEKTYIVANASAADQFNVGSSTTYLTDASGAIVYVTAMADGNKRFGFYADFVSGKSNEDNSAMIKFYDPETKDYFTVMICDYVTDLQLISDQKGEGKLFWMDISSNNKVKKGGIKLAENVTTTDDKNLSENVIFDQGTTVYKTGSLYTLAGSTNKTYSTTYGSVFVRPDDMPTKSTFSYSTFTMTASSETKYRNPIVYQIKRSGKTYVFMWIDKFKGLQNSSNIYIVKKIGGSSKVDDNDICKVSYFNYKTGKENAENGELIFLSSVIDELKLSEGDMFTYYDDTDTQGVNFDKTENIFILLRANELAADKTKAAALEKTLSDEKNASVYKDGFRIFRIYATNLAHSYYNATLQVPVYFDREDENNMMIYFARTSTDGNHITGEINTFVPGEAGLGDALSSMYAGEGTEAKQWTGSNLIDALGTNSLGAKISSSTKIFVYDKEQADDEKITAYSAPKAEDIINILSGVTTLEAVSGTNAAEVDANIAKCSLAYSYFSNYYQALNYLYIIK